MKKYLIAVASALSLSACFDPVPPTSASGVQKVDAVVKVQSNGMTIEQANVKRRLEIENQPASIKHLYVLSAYSGEFILYSTVKGKVTSSGKRLTPSTINGSFSVKFPGINQGAEEGRRDWTTTNEVLGDDGTYGSSAEYLYWFDQADNYHQQYVTGGMILHVANQPMVFGKVTQTVEVVK